MSILKLKDSQGNWIGVPTIKGTKGDKGNGISSAVLNNDYTLTLTFTDGTTYTTPSIRGEKGEQGEPATDMEIHICSASEYDSTTRMPTIANPNDKTFYLVPTEDGTSPDLFTEWVYVNGAWEMFGSAKIDLSGYLTDVTIGGTSVVSNGVAEIPIASSSKAGAVKVGTALSNGLYINDNGELLLYPAPTSVIKRGTDNKMPITAKNEYASTFYGLAEASGDTTQSQSSNPVGTYTDEAKASIKNMLGVEDNMVVTVTGTGQIRQIDKSLSEIISALEKGSNVVVYDNYAIYPYVGTTLINGALVYAFGISVLYDNINVLNGYLIGSDGEADFAMPVNQQTTIPQLNDVQINGTSIVENGVANVPEASASAYGVVKANGSLGIEMSLGTLKLAEPSASDLKSGTSKYKAITPKYQKESAFYGLAKAAGDTTQSQSSNAVGNYTEDAKSAISDMLNGAIQISGTDPTITAKSGIRYICGEVLSLNFTPSANGICDVMFTSGSTPTVLTLPNTVKMPEWFIIEANTTYEINIADGIYGAVTSWTL